MLKFDRSLRVFHGSGILLLARVRLNASCPGDCVAAFYKAANDLLHIGIIISKSGAMLLQSILEYLAGVNGTTTLFCHGIR